MENKKKQEEEAEEICQHGYDLTTAPNFYIDRTRITSNVCTDTKGNKIEHKVVDNYAQVVYSKKEDIKKNKFFLENFSTNFPHAAKFVPFGLQRI